MEVSFDPKPVVLEGHHVRLEPLEHRHAEDLFEAGRDPDIWTYLPRHSYAFPDLADAHAWIDEALQDQARGDEIPFTTVLRSTGRAIGSTRYLAIVKPHCGLEIGWTWIAKEHQRSAVNTESKLLLFAHAFEDLGAIRVQLKTDSRNERSRHAIERIGAVKEGILRNHYLLRDGYRRASVYYSVIDTEWPTVKARLQAMMER